MPLLTPPWLEQMDQSHFDYWRLRNRYFIKTAALYATPTGRLTDLADAIGMSHPSLSRCYDDSGAQIGVKMTLRLEKLLGQDVLPRKLLRPDLFA